MEDRSTPPTRPHLAAERVTGPAHVGMPTGRPPLVVFLVGLVSGIMPSNKGNLEEERRICFVGMSRAMKLLYLSNSLTYLGQASKRSIFLDQILGIKEPSTGLK